MTRSEILAEQGLSTPEEIEKAFKELKPLDISMFVETKPEIKSKSLKGEKNVS